MNLLKIQIAEIPTSPRKAAQWTAFASHGGKELTFFPRKGKRNTKAELVKSAFEQAQGLGYNGVQFD